MTPRDLSIFQRIPEDDDLLWISAHCIISVLQYSTVWKSKVFNEKGFAFDCVDLG